MEPLRRFVYVIVSVADPQRRYVGLTWDVSKRLQSHNEGQSLQTSRHRPWRLVVYLGFSTADGAAAFAKYLKSGAGRVVVDRLVGD